MFDAFISYSHVDKRFADTSCAALEAAGIRCWIAPRDIGPGQEWAEAIIAAIDRCSVMVLIFSTHANESSQVRREIERAVHNSVPIVPVRIDDSEATGSLAYFLAGVHWLDALTRPIEQHLTRLANIINSLSTARASQQPAEHTFPISHTRISSPPAVKLADGRRDRASSVSLKGNRNDSMQSFFSWPRWVITSITITLIATLFKGDGFDWKYLKTFMLSSTDSAIGSPEYVAHELDSLAVASGDRATLDSQMFELSQFGISSTAADDIARATARGGRDTGTAQAIRIYQERLDYLEQLEVYRKQITSENVRSDRVAAVNQQIEAVRQQLELSSNDIPAVAKQKVATNQQPVTIDDIQSKLKSDEAFAFFLTTDETSYGFFIRSTGHVTQYIIPLTRKDIAALITRLRDSTVERPRGLPTPDFAAAYRLYLALFGPIQEQLEGIAKILIARSGDLTRYPFEALVTKPDASVSGGVPGGEPGGDYRAVPFFIRRFSISYFPSPRIFVNLRQSPPSPIDLLPFIGFGDVELPTKVQLNASFPPNKCGDDYPALSGLERLPNTRVLVSSLSNTYGKGATAILGKSFTRRRLRAADLGRYRVVLIATHFLLIGDLKCREGPIMVVSVPDDAPNASEGFVTPADLNDTVLNADVVVLAGSSSGSSSNREPSEWARTFFRAGARSLILANWSIASGAAVPLLMNTLRAAIKSRDYGRALQIAQLNMIDTAGQGNNPIELSHPNYWAAFSYIGETP
jgi:CHAT domain-containing protein